jgi:phosphatidylserine decarboxylase
MIPTQKVTAAALGGAVATVAVWLVSVFTDVDPSAEVGAALATLLAFAAGFLVTETRPVDPVPGALAGDAGQGIGTIVLVAVLAVLAVIGVIYLLRGGL